MEEGPARDGKTTALLAAGVFLILALAAFWPVAVGRRTFFHMDLLYEHLPVWQDAQRQLLGGHLPFWIDGEYCGQPSLFIQEVPLFYPPTVPLLLTGGAVDRLADAFTLFHFWLAGLAMFLLVRNRTGRPAAGLFGGIAWMLSARQVQSATWPNAVAVAALLPLLVLGILRIGDGRRRSGVLLAAVAGGLALTTARPQSLLATAPIVACLAAAAVLRGARRARVVLDLALAGGLALALGAPSLLPSAALLPETSRSHGLSADAEAAPMLSRGQDLDMVFLPVDGRARWPETAAYPGILVYALALSAIVAWRRGGPGLRRAELVACGAGGLAGLILAFGDAGPYRWVSRLPVIRGFRVPERFLLSWSLALALAASLALGYWLSRVRRPAALAAVCVVVLAADLLLHARRAAPTAESGVYAIEPAIVPAVRARVATDEIGFPRRFIPLTAMLDPTAFPDPGRRTLLREASSLKGTLGMRYGLESAYGAGPTFARIESLLGRPTLQALALAGVSVMVLSARDAAGRPNALAPPVLETPALPPLPRAFLAPEALVVPEADALRVAISPRLDPRRTVILEEGEPLAPDPEWKGDAASVHLVSRGPSRLALEASAPSPAVLVVMESWERGWRARVDGADAPVLRADAAFRAVRIPAGAHRVELRYEPPGLREGLLLGGVGLLGLLLAARRLRDESSPPVV
jgi:hypothetical protein